jgi:hypothetical protein
MKAALSRILEFFVGHGRGGTDTNSYCVCGALKPQATSTTSLGSTLAEAESRGQLRSAVSEASG